MPRLQSFRRFAVLAGLPLAGTWACSSSNPARVSTVDGGADVGTHADAKTGTTPCTTDAECSSQLPSTTPPNCASASCNALRGVCEFAAKDADGDGHAAASCSANGVTIQTGDDCDDQDPNLYPGHSEACTTGDGGVSRWPHGNATGACKTGNLSCEAGGVLSACIGELPECPSNETCVNQQCTGQCGPGQTQCSGNSALETCTANGTWGAPVPCAGEACIAVDAGTGSGTASCGGACSPGAIRCGTGTQATYVQTCDATGAWTTATVGCSDVCTMGQCAGNCVPGQTECGTSNNVLTCPASGTWPSTGGESCTAETKACVQTGTTGNPSATCQGSCAPNAVAACGACGKGTETCTATGNPGTCSGDVPETASCGVSSSCMNGTSHCGQACVGDTTNFGAACGSCGGAVTCGGGCSVPTPGNYGQGCGTCGGTVQCDGSCSRGSTTGSGGPAETINLDFNTDHCTANTINFAWGPNFAGMPTNPSGTYTVNYNFTDHNNMSGSFSTVFYIGCSGSPTSGNGYSEAGLTTTQVGSLTCPVGESVVWYPTVCGQSGSCCGDPSVNWNVTGWTTSNAICD